MESNKEIIFVTFDELVCDVLFSRFDFMTLEEYQKGNWKNDYFYCTNEDYIIFNSIWELVEKLKAEGKNDYYIKLVMREYDVKYNTIK